MDKQEHVIKDLYIEAQQRLSALETEALWKDRSWTRLGWADAGRALKYERYHNRAHCTHVALAAHVLANLAGEERASKGIDGLRFDQILDSMLVAGTFHDAAHVRSGALEDRFNIDAALAVYRDFEHLFDVPSRLVVTFIEATENPSALAEDSPYACLLMRDADLLASLGRILFEGGHTYEIRNQLHGEGYPSSDCMDYISSHMLTPEGEQTFKTLRFLLA